MWLEAASLQVVKKHINHTYLLGRIEIKTINYIIKNLTKLKMKKYKRYSKFEKDVILHWVNKSPNNLRQAFRWAAFHLNNRTAHAIEQFYYTTLCHQREQSYVIKRNKDVTMAKFNSKPYTSKYNITMNCTNCNIRIV